MGEFRMPSLGADMDAGSVIAWLVGPGDAVHRGDVIATVDTDKAAVDVECFEDGVVTQLLVEPGVRVPVGTPLAVIAPPGVQTGVGHPSGPVEAPAAAPAPVPVSTPAPAPVPSPVPSQAAVSAPVPTAVGPVIRRAAAAAGVDLTAVAGTGVGGRVTREDVMRAAKPLRVRATPYARRRATELGVALADVTPADGSVIHSTDVLRVAGQRQPAGTERGGQVVVPVARPAGPGEQVVGPPPPAPTPRTPTGGPEQGRAESMRRAIARLMSRSNREIPHYHLRRTVDVAAATAWLIRYNEDRPVAERVTLAAVIAVATARAAGTVRDLNGWWTDDRFHPAEGVHLGVPVSLRDGGLLTPVIHDADQLDVPGMMASLRDLVERARRGSLRASELTGASITLTNLGERGADEVHGVIYPPQVALVGVGRVVERPWAVDGMLTVRPTVTVTLAGDHRASDGHRGGLLLEALADRLAHPEELV